MTEMETVRSSGPAATRLALATVPDPSAGAFHVCGADGIARTVGDPWVEDSVDMGLAVTMKATDGVLNVTIALRMDDLEERRWSELEAESIVVALLPMSPVAAFVLAFDNAYGSAFYGVGADPADAAAVRRLAIDPGATKTLAVVGIGRGKIRSIKVGVGLERIWELLAETFLGSPLVFDDAALHVALGRLRLPPKTIFIGAMATYFMQEQDRPGPRRAGRLLRRRDRRPPARGRP